MIDKKPCATFVLFAGGNDRQGDEAMGRELGMISEEKIPEFLVALGGKVAESGMDYETWICKNPDGVERLAEGYLLN